MSGRHRPHWQLPLTSKCELHGQVLGTTDVLQISTRRPRRFARRTVIKCPKTYDELCKLPGVGPYTAGAVASTVFGQRVPAVDGNVVRVICRLGAVRATAAKAHRHCTAQATRLLPEENGPLCGQLNEALIEFGATVCTPRKPLCEQCPLTAHCRAFAEVSTEPQVASVGRVGDIEDVCSLCSSDEDVERPTAVTVFPLTAVKTKQRVEHTVVCFVEVRNGNSGVLVPIVQRPVQGLLGGFFELPQVTIAADKSAVAHARRSAADQLLASLLGVGDAALIVERRDCGSVGHLFSHIRQTMFVEHVVLAESAKELIDRHIVDQQQRLQARTVKLVTHQQLTDDAVSAGNHKAIKLALTGVGGEKSTKKRKTAKRQ
eukprot:TRINITY_DN1293_c0_g1_i1.p1 TRINITY_DN1293_c0_g1~~TRINITY_DN1293_c0_g1_i1.p1  ORF type:complete len:374 (+),score=51.51 TRINITY_DN1293_c0_g1_i1:341-1462(+)